MHDLLETLDLDPPGGRARASVIWLHGLGANMHDFEPIIPELGLPAALGVRFVFPNAPLRPVTVNGGMVMRAWFDVYGFDFREEDDRGIRESAAATERLIEREKGLGVPAGRIVLAGFSQGGAIALHLGLRHGERLAGILALSTCLPVAGTLAAERSEANRDVPVFMAHGTQDPLIAIDLARESRRLLDEAGYAVEWREYPMAHQVSPHEVADIAAWLETVLAVDVE